MSKNSKYATREEYLEAAVTRLKREFTAKGYEVPAVRVSCGWPHIGGTKKKGRTMGQCWPSESATDGIIQIFVSPYIEEPLEEFGVLPVLVHELCHAAVGTGEGHNKVFGKCARAVGLQGKLTSTTAGDNLMEFLKAVSEGLGDYPHARLDLTKAPTKKQTTRMLKAECEQCGYTVRLSQKWVDDVGAPHCPKHGAMKLDKPADKEDDDD